MVSTPFTATKTLSIERAHAAPLNRFALMFQPPSLRPPVLDEMLDDLERLIAKVARKYNDQSCPELNYDELIGEGRWKLSYVIEANGFVKANTRVKFFKFFAAALNNHVRSLVHKYRYTEKRTGVKPPPKNEQFTGEQRMKTAEVRIDDEEAGVQVESDCGGADQEHRQLVAEYESILMPAEILVFRQLTEPNAEALVYAQLDAYLGKTSDKVKIVIKNEHLARGLNLSQQEFDNLVLSVRDKITKHRSMTQTAEQAQFERNAALAQLEDFFNLQIPRTIDEMVIRRLLTLAARDQFDKVRENPQIAALLESVGAKVPKASGGNLSCYGVLYQKKHRICSSCSLRNACATESSNFGLGKVVISPRLLGAKQTRTPAILPHDPSAEEVPAPGSEEMEITQYLEENFKKTSHKGQTFYVHKEKLPGNQSRNLFQVENDGANFRLRFCSPSRNLQPRLKLSQKCWYAPLDRLSVSDVIGMIDQHAKETYVVA